MRKYLDLDDVYLVPVPSSVNSRNDVDLSVELAPFLKLSIPIIASPMKGIVNPDVINEISRLGGIGILHRFYDDSYIWSKDVRKCTGDFGIALGLHDARYRAALDFGCKILCVDVANGYLESVADIVDKVSTYIIQNNYDTLLMAGNVVTDFGVGMLEKKGANLIRVGIGVGTLCSTKTVTGVYVPYFSALQDAARPLKDDTLIVADGGIHNSGDAVKCFVAGADLVMIGSLFARAFESDHNGTIYGMASRKLQEEYYHSTKSIEGIESSVEKSAPLESIIKEFCYGIRSACTYLDCKNIQDLQTKVQWLSK